MLVLTSGGSLTMVHRDSRETLGCFVTRAWELHSARLRAGAALTVGPEDGASAADGAVTSDGAGTAETPRATGADWASGALAVSKAARKKVFERIGCTY